MGQVPISVQDAMEKVDFCPQAFFNRAVTAYR